MARIHPSRFARADAAADVLERLARDFDDDWDIFADAVIVADGEEGEVDLVLVNPRLGVVLIGVVGDEADASPEEAAAAMRRMLREAGFEDRFVGRLPIVALTVRPSRAGELRRRVAEAIARQPPLTIPGNAWVEFVVDLLRPAAELLPLVERVEPLSAAPPPLRRGEVRLGAPSRDDAWRVYAETGSAVGATPAAPPAAPVPLALDDGPLADSTDGKKSYLWPAVGLALCTVIGILAGMAMMQHAHEPGGKATQEASSKAAAY